MAAMCNASVLFFSFSVVQFMQPRWSAPEERHNFLATHDPGLGNSHFI